MRSVSRLLLAGCLTAGAVLGPALPALAAGSGTTVVQPSAEAWYRSTPLCALPTGCVDATGAPSPYADDTLHVAVNGGQEEARTYLQLDLSALPAGTKPSGGTLLLPVASGAGTRAAGSATMQACAVKVDVQDADGSFAQPPAVDCEGASTPATYVPAEGENPAAFTVALAAFASAWTGSAAPGAVALLPSADTAPPATWHVAFSGREREGEDVVPIRANVAYVSAAVDTDAEPVPFVPPFVFEPAPAFEPAPIFDTGSSFAAPPLTVDTPIAPQPEPQQAPVAAAEQQVVQVASVIDTSFRYPAVFLLPLLFGVAVAWLGRALTRDLVDV